MSKIYTINDEAGKVVLKGNKVISIEGNQEELLDKLSNYLVSGVEYEGKLYKKSANHQFKTYQDVDAFIHVQKSRVYSLDHFKKFMEDHGSLQLLLKCIHVCGTNGKGSTSNYMRNVLTLANYKVGFFTSPALNHRLDIIQVNGVSIDEKTVVDYCNFYMDEFVKYELSMFEIEMFLSVIYFFEKQVDYVIYEVGLGGLLDATNIINPILCVNTNISYDHMNFLGDTLESIALNKAGIMKKGIPFITGETKQECLDVFYQQASIVGCEVIKVKEYKQIDINSFIYDNHTYTLKALGEYQLKNASLAIEALKHIDGDVHEYIQEGIEEAIWPGRFEKIHENPLIIIDGAHNEDGMKQFCHTAKKYSNIKVIFSALGDKDTKSMIQYLLSLTDDVVVTEFEHERADKAENLAHGYPVKIEKNYQKAIDDAYSHTGVVFITGSLYFISKVRSYILEKG